MMQFTYRSAVPPSRPLLREEGCRLGRAAGFTLMELIVSIGLVSLLLFMINSVFNQTQQAISRGSAVSELIAASRATSEQFTTDAKQMLLFENEIERLTEPPGFLVIIQDTRSGVLFPNPQRPNQAESSWTPRDIRTDQIVFFRKADRLESLTPGSNDRFDSDARAAVARVWYGHVYRESPPPSELPVTEMMLGRQAALLVGRNDLMPDSGSGIHADADTTALTLGTDIWDLNVAGIGSGLKFWEGATDVIHFGTINDYRDEFFKEDGTGLYTQVPAAIDGPYGKPSAAYEASALSWAFPDPDKRLIADPHVEFPAADADALTEDVGRTHAAFIPYVSDFIVEFAADIKDTLNYNPDTGTYEVPSSGPLDDLPDDTPDTYLGGNGEDIIKWYTLIDANPDNDDGTGDLIGNVDSSRPVTWPLPAGPHSGGDGLPTPITLPSGARAIVFGHTGDDIANPPSPAGVVEGQGKWWPYLIRIRYRVHNRDGDFTSLDPVTGEPISGRWFEQIIPIPR